MRIHHVTLPASNPPLVAAALAEIVGGRVIPLPHPAGNLLVYAGDDDGSAIEVWPATTRAGVGQHHTETRDLPLPEAWPHHAYLTFDGPIERALEVFRRHGWHVDRVHGWHVDRVHNGPPGGPGFALLRGWIENQTVIELGDRDMREQYEAFFRTARGQAEQTG